MQFLYQRIENDSKRLEDLFRLRYLVYCTECGFEDPSNHRGGVERDIYDDYSVHFAILEEGTGDIIGTMRLVLYSELPFPVEQHMQVDRTLLPDVPKDKIGEISRLAISKSYRKRLIDKGLYSLSNIVIEEESCIEHRRKNFESQLVAGLYQCVYHESVKRELTHWYAAMARGLYCLLRRWGISWQQIGPEIDYHGLRRPYVSSVEANADMARQKFPELLTIPYGWNG